MTLLWTVGATEIIIIGVVVLLLFGTRIPMLMRNLGRGVTSFKQGLKESADVEDEDKPAKPTDSGASR